MEETRSYKGELLGVMYEENSIKSRENKNKKGKREDGGSLGEVV